MEMPDDHAVLTVNLMKKTLATTVRAVVSALQDGQISAMEGLMLGVQGMQLASTILTILQGMTPEQARGVLAVLEHGDFVVTPRPTVRS